MDDLARGFGGDFLIARRRALLRVIVVLFALLLAMVPGRIALAAELSVQGQKGYSRGMVAVQQQDYKLALRCFLEAQKADPDAPDIWFNLGLASSKLPGYELRALAWFQAYLLKAPSAQNADVVRKQVGVLEASFEAKMSNILNQLSQLINQNESDNSIREGFYIANARGYLGDFEKSKKEFLKFTGKSSWREAFTEFPEANLFSDPDKIFAMIEKGQIAGLLDFGINGRDFNFGFNDTQFGEYMRHVTEDRYPAHPDHSLAAALSWIAGLSASYRVINGTFDPGPHPDPYWAEYYSQAYMSRARGERDYNQKIKWYDQAIKIDPKFSDAYCLRAYAWESIDDLDHAISDYDECIRLTPPRGAYALNYSSRARVWKMKRDFNKALSDYDKAIKISPTNTGFIASRGGLWESVGDFERALADYEEALKISPDSNWLLPLRNSARVHSCVGKHADAPQPESGTLAADVVRQLKESRDYRDLFTMSQAKLGQSGYLANPSLREAVDLSLALMLADATAPNVVDSPNGQRIEFSVGCEKRSVAVVGDLGKATYREQVVSYFVERIVANILDDKNIQEALVQFRSQVQGNRSQVVNSSDKRILHQDNKAITAIEPIPTPPKTIDLAKTKKAKTVKPIPAAPSIAPKTPTLKKYTYQGRTVELAPEFVFDITGKVGDAYAFTELDRSDYSAVSVELKDSVKEEFRKFSEHNIGREAGVGNKDKLLILAVMREPIPDGKFQITGKYTMKELQNLAEEVKGR